MGINQYSGELYVLLKDRTQCSQWESNTGPLDLESDALPLRNHDCISLNAFICPCYTADRMVSYPNHSVLEKPGVSLLVLSEHSFTIN